VKLRSDFVTNSSSSSFIIGNKDDNTTVETVFDMLKSFCQEFIEKRQKLIDDCDKYDMIWNEKTKSFQGKDSDHKMWNHAREIEEKYGISIFDGYQDISYINFKTYAEYQEYWLNKINNSTEDDYETAPFSIIDYSSSPRYRIDCGKWGIENPDTNGSDIFGWYVSCGDMLFVDDEDDIPEYMYWNGPHCKVCGVKNHEPYEECEIVKKMQNGEITKDNAVLLVLGKVCLHSECGQLPDYVVSKLRSISNFACNHMG
jgi:hypothetical protein